MKKILGCLLAAWLFSSSTMAQNVGIGTNSPAYRLDVSGRMRVKTGTVGNAGTSSGIWLEDFRTANRDVVFMGMADSIRWGLWGQDGIGWNGLQYNSRTGAVGIGISPSTFALAIGGNGPSPQLAMYASNNTLSGNVSTSDSTMVINSAYGSSFCFPLPCTGTPARDLIINPPPTSVFGITGRVGIFTRTPTTDFQVSGRVQIGSGTPATGYQLSVNGKVICTEARVQSTAAWPDYVFSDNYTLQPLEQIEKFIQANKHLPGIPSAAQVEKEGFDLGDMNRRLLEQIEQLTLHLIELKKENQHLNYRIAALERN